MNVYLSRLFWKFPVYRRLKIVRYFRSRSDFKLHLGAGTNYLAGWLNTDIVFHPGFLYLDAASNFPFANNTFQYVFSEHMIEHLSAKEGELMLKECWRVLKPGGRIRLATPNLEKVLSLSYSNKTAMEKQYARRLGEVFFPKQNKSGVYLMNYYFHAWGHRFIYDRRTLGETVKKIGFIDVRFHQAGKSTDVCLRNIESHGFVLGEEINRFETMVVEAVKPSVE